MDDKCGWRIAGRVAAIIVACASFAFTPYLLFFAFPADEVLGGTPVMQTALFGATLCCLVACLLVGRKVLRLGPVSLPCLVVEAFVTTLPPLDGALSCHSACRCPRPPRGLAFGTGRFTGQSDTSRASLGAVIDCGPH